MTPCRGCFILMVLQSNQTALAASQVAVMVSQTNPALPWTSRGTINLDPALGNGVELSNVSLGLTRQHRGRSPATTSSCTTGVPVASQTVVIRQSRSHQRRVHGQQLRVHRAGTDRAAAGTGADVRDTSSTRSPTMPAALPRKGAGQLRGVRHQRTPHGGQRIAWVCTSGIRDRRADERLPPQRRRKERQPR